jgi:hypothetical protein
MSTSEEFIHDGVPYRVVAAPRLEGRYTAICGCPRCKWAGISSSYATSREALDAAMIAIQEHHIECSERALEAAHG